MFKDVVARDYKEEGSGTGATNYKLLFISTIITAYYVSSVGGGAGVQPAIRWLMPGFQPYARSKNTPRKRNRTCSNLTQAISRGKLEPCHWPLLACFA